MKTTPQGSSSHVYKDFPLHGSFTKDYKVFYNSVHNNLHILFFQSFLFMYDIFTSFDNI
jgi:hypothetical protein